MSAAEQVEQSKEFWVTAGKAQWKERLVTKEDPTHIHKALGIACLISFIWRTTQISASADMGFQSKPYLTIPTLCLHLALSLSSLEFKIPYKRIKEGSRIWPEYRLHSIVFASRSIAAILLYWFEQQYGYTGTATITSTTTAGPFYKANVVIVLATMAAADLSTRSQKHQSNSIRELDVSRATGYFFSVCQFYATAGVLFGVRRYTIQFLNVMVVQLNPFLMTLRRKNLISHHATVTVYGFLLVFGFLVELYEYTLFGTSMLRTVAFVGNAAILWRMTPLPMIPKNVRNVVQNKYLIWSVMGVVVQCIRPMAYQEMSVRRQCLFTAGFISVLAVGVIKCNAKSYSHGIDDDDGVKKAIKKAV